VWEKLEPASQAAIKASGTDAARRISERARIEMSEAVAAMEKRGLQVVRLDDTTAALWRDLTLETTPKLRALSADPALFDQALAELERVRAAK
jgi:TRAP-type C4-dicarboxylate transport system substrate-binding protein